MEKTLHNQLYYIKYFSDKYNLTHADEIISFASKQTTPSKLCVPRCTA